MLPRTRLYAYSVLPDTLKACEFIQPYTASRSEIEDADVRGIRASPSDEYMITMGGGDTDTNDMRRNRLSWFESQYRASDGNCGMLWEPIHP